jgi:hypothetical protein
MVGPAHPPPPGSQINGAWSSPVQYKGSQNSPPSPSNDPLYGTLAPLIWFPGGGCMTDHLWIGDPQTLYMAARLPKTPYYALGTAWTPFFGPHVGGGEWVARAPYLGRVRLGLGTRLADALDPRGQSSLFCLHGAPKPLSWHPGTLIGPQGQPRPRIWNPWGPSVHPHHEPRI